MFNFFKPKDKHKIFDWQQSPAHLNLLAYFSEPRQTKDTIKFQKWSEPLGEPVEVAIKRFFDLKLIQRADPENHLIAVYNASELKRFLKDRGLSQSGSKEVMAKRLVEQDIQGVQSLLAGHIVLICNEQGKAIAEEYKQFEIKRRKESINQSEKHLIEGNYRKSALTVADYEAKCVFQRGMNMSWSSYDPEHDEIILRYIFTRTPQILIKRGWDKLQNIRVVAGMIHLWGNARLAELACGVEIENAATALTSHAQYLYELDTCRECGIKYVTVATCNDDLVCPHCRKVAKIKKYKLDEVPEFPLADCANENGCRCWIGGTID